MSYRGQGKNSDENNTAVVTADSKTKSSSSSCHLGFMTYESKESSLYSRRKCVDIEPAACQLTDRHGRIQAGTTDEKE